MNTGQTVYEQLQEILDRCIELGWKPRDYEKGFVYQKAFYKYEDAVKYRKELEKRYL